MKNFTHNVSMMNYMGMNEDDDDDDDDMNEAIEKRLQTVDVQNTLMHYERRG